MNLYHAFKFLTSQSYALSTMQEKDLSLEIVYLKFIIIAINIYFNMII
jgi:hypothetical protein